MLLSQVMIGVFEVTEQRLADQARMIRVNVWLSAVELEEIRREVSYGIQECENVENPDMMVNEHSVQGDSGVQMSPVMEKDDLPTEQSFTQEVVNSMEEKGCSMEEVQLAKEILESFKNGEEPPPNLRNIERKRLKEKVDDANRVISPL